MNDIIKSIEAEQLKENVPQFNVGDTVKVYGKIKEGNRERILTVLALRRHGHCIHQTLRRLKLYAEVK